MQGETLTITERGSYDLGYEEFDTIVVKSPSVGIKNAVIRGGSGSSEITQADLQRRAEGSN